ncbi:MAG: prepilin-type N-terminal cleavage/methylation domain-containing protein [Syntrophales bacterium]|jgi:Tfp pilus assembly protein PilV|nr:prepilin-type N-terminal cleavage/methylation domain-containing protein [Syntrophales bacterium]
MRPGSKGKNVHGFTLVEVVMTIFLIVVAFMGIASITTMVINGNASSKMSTTASALASAKLEDIKSRDFSDASLAAGVHTDVGNPLLGVYLRSWEVTDTMDAANASVTYKTITLRMTWNGQNRARSMSLKTIKTASI